MAGRIQPIVYKPTSPTKYLDAYTQTQLQRQDAQRKAQEKRRAERQKQMDQMGLYTDREYFSPVIQRYHDQYLKEFHDKSMARPQDMGRFINEFAAKTKLLDKDDSTVKDSYFKALDNREQYRDWDVFVDTFRTDDGGEELDLSSYSGLTAAARPFSKLEKTFDLGGFIEKQGNAYLKNLANDPEARAEYFHERLITRPLGEMTINEMYTAVKDGKREEVMGQILSLNPNAMAQASYDVTGKSSYTPEDVQGIVSQTTQAQFYRLGTDVLRKMVKSGDDDDGTIGVSVEVSDDVSNANYEESKATGIGSYNQVRLPGVENVIMGDFTANIDGEDRRGKIVDLKVGTEGSLLGEKVAVFQYADEGKGVVQQEEIPYEKYKDEILNQVKYSGKEKKAAQDAILSWEKKFDEIVKPSKFDPKTDIDPYYDKIIEILKGGGDKASVSTDSEAKLQKIKDLLGRDDIEFTWGLNDIKIGDQKLSIYSDGKENEKYKNNDNFRKAIWESSDRDRSILGGKKRDLTSSDKTYVDQYGNPVVDIEKLTQEQLERLIKEGKIIVK